jgi:hypothetical protein
MPKCPERTGRTPDGAARGLSRFCRQRRRARFCAGQGGPSQGIDAAQHRCVDAGFRQWLFRHHRRRTAGTRGHRPGARSSGGCGGPADGAATGTGDRAMLRRACDAVVRSHPPCPVRRDRGTGRGGRRARSRGLAVRWRSCRPGAGSGAAIVAGQGSCGGNAGRRAESHAGRRGTASDRPARKPGGWACAGKRGDRADP